MVFELLLPPPPPPSSSSAIAMNSFRLHASFLGVIGTIKKLTTVSLRTACYFLNTPITIPRADFFRSLCLCLSLLKEDFFCCCYFSVSHSKLLVSFFALIMAAATRTLTSRAPSASHQIVRKIYIPVKKNAATKQRKSSTNECKSINEPTNELHHFVCLLYGAHTVCNAIHKSQKSSVYIFPLLSLNSRFCFLLISQLKSFKHCNFLFSHLTQMSRNHLCEKMRKLTKARHSNWVKSFFCYKTFAKTMIFVTNFLLLKINLMIESSLQAYALNLMCQCWLLTRDRIDRSHSIYPWIFCTIKLYILVTRRIPSFRKSWAIFFIASDTERHEKIKEYSLFFAVANVNKLGLSNRIYNDVFVPLSEKMNSRIRAHCGEMIERWNFFSTIAESWATL